jgi:hypothetical protein
MAPRIVLLKLLTVLHLKPTLGLLAARSPRRLRIMVKVSAHIQTALYTLKYRNTNQVTFTGQQAYFPNHPDQFFIDLGYEAEHPSATTAT